MSIYKELRERERKKVAVLYGCSLVHTCQDAVPQTSVAFHIQLLHNKASEISEAAGFGVPHMVADHLLPLPC